LSKLPVVSGKEVVKALAKAGFVVMRQRGSHITMAKEIAPKKYLVTVVPMHRELAKGTLRKIIADSSLSVQEFQKLL
jgi:predicted RNA binding protein YcfA (HicA-like mRNA interferase family)